MYMYNNNFFVNTCHKWFYLSTQCLLLPVAFALGCTIMVQFEFKLVGIQFTNLFESTVSG